MKLSQATQDMIGMALITRRDHCQKEMQEAHRVFTGAEADEQEAFWRGEWEKAVAALREWFERERTEK